MKKFLILILACAVLVCGIVFFNYAHSQRSSTKEPSNEGENGYTASQSRETDEYLANSTENNEIEKNEKEEMQGDSPEALEYYKQKDAKQQRVLELLKQTYGEKIDEIIEKIRNETQASRDEYQFPESGKELVEKLLDLIEYENISEEDREAAKELVSEIVDNNLSKDKEIMARVEKLGIK